MMLINISLKFADCFYKNICSALCFYYENTEEKP